MTECPMPTVLLAFAVGDVGDESTAAAVSEHLEHCEECAAFVEAVMGEDEESEIEESPE